VGAEPASGARHPAGVAAGLVTRHRTPLRTDASGFTLVEVLLAVSTLAAVVLLATASLRVGLSAWEAGQRRADVQQEMRSLVELIGEALASAYPYRGRTGLSAEERTVLFEGAADEVRFVTSAPPLVLDAPLAPFHAVILRRGPGDELRVAERVVPAEAPFTDDPGTPLFRSVTRFALEYQDEAGAWHTRWDGRTAEGLPAAVKVAVTVGTGSRARELPTLVVPVLLGVRSP
jgi:Type II secretion system (T2SS), protein J